MSKYNGCYKNHAESRRWVDTEPKKAFKRFIKNFKDGGNFQTITGEVNTIESIDDKYIYIKCKTKDSNYKIKKESLKNAINILYHKKSVNRSDLATQSSYNTSLMGILLSVFKNKIRVIKDVVNKGGYKAILKGVRYIPSGMSTASAKDWVLMKKAGIKTVMISYYSVGKNLSWYCWCKLLNMFVVVDSGAFSVASKRFSGEDVPDIDVYEYANFIKKYKDRILSYINLDVIGDLKASRENFNILKELVGFSPIPVWHPNNIIENSNWEELELMTKESDIVAIGGTHKNFFKDDKAHSKKKALFNKINKLYPNTQFHYMGGSSNLILEDLWEFGQADSTGWTYGRRNNQLYSFKNGKLGRVTEKRPLNMSSLEAVYFNLVNLTNFEKHYGETYLPKLTVDTWNPNESDISFDEEIEKVAGLLTSIKNKMLSELKSISDLAKPSFLNTQLEWNL